MNRIPHHRRGDNRSYHQRNRLGIDRKKLMEGEEETYFTQSNWTILRSFLRHQSRRNHSRTSHVNYLRTRTSGTARRDQSWEEHEVRSSISRNPDGLAWISRSELDSETSKSVGNGHGHGLTAVMGHSRRYSRGGGRRHTLV